MVFVVLLAIVVAVVFVSVQAIADDQQKKLLKSRADQLNSTMQAYISTITSALNTFALLTRLDSQQFVQVLGAMMGQQTQSQAQRQSNQNNGSSVGLITRQGSAWVVTWAPYGKGLRVGEHLAGPRLALVSSAAGTPESATYVVQGTRLMGIALGAPMAKSGSAVYFEFSTSGVTDMPAYESLNVALYRTPEADPANLLFSTARSIPIKGDVVTFQILIGHETWLMVVGAKHPLTGWVASNLALVLVLVSIVTGVMVIALIETVVRRRNYAMALVEERTVALRASLEELKHAQDRLVSSQRMAALGEMAASVGHELRNPLAVLTNSMYIIRHGLDGYGNQRVHRNLDTADREIAAATLIVSDLLEFARPRQPASEAIDIADLVDETLSAAPPREGVHVHVRAGNVPPIVGDRAQLRQVLLNLLINAYDAMPEGGDVTIEAAEADGDVRIAISDTGIGAKPEELARVFEPFWTSKTKGIGLGLAVCKRIVETHHGTIELRARPDRGCTAILTLPRDAVRAGAPS